MKKQLLFIFLISFAFVQSNAQILNSSFENWTPNATTNLDSLDNYQTTNSLYFNYSTVRTYDKASIAKVAGYSGNGVAVRNVVGSTLGQVSDTLAGFAVLSADGATGIPFTQRPTSLKGYYKFTQGAPNGSSTLDTAFIAIELQKGTNGDSIGGGYLQIFQTQSTFKAFTINIGYIDQTTMPDTLLLAFGSSMTGKLFPGTELVLDEFSLTGVVAGTKLPVFVTAGIQAYPNPTSDLLNIKNIPSEASGVEVRDFSGRAIKSAAVNAGFVQLSTGDLPAGLYLYNLTDGEGNVLYTNRFNVVR